jgi:hypothetical protein
MSRHARYIAAAFMRGASPYALSIAWSLPQWAIDDCVRLATRSRR